MHRVDSCSSSVYCSKCLTVLGISPLMFLSAVWKLTALDLLKMLTLLCSPYFPLVWCGHYCVLCLPCSPLLRSDWIFTHQCYFVIAWALCLCPSLLLFKQLNKCLTLDDMMNDGWWNQTIVGWMSMKINCIVSLYVFFFFLACF